MARRKLSEADLGSLIRDLGGDWHKFRDRQYCPMCHNLIYKMDNVPFDGEAVINGFSIPIEVKSGQTAFPFGDIKEHQREGLLEWQRKHHRPAWLCLQMGIQPAGRGELQRRMWLVPMNIWLNVEELLQEADFKSLPYSIVSTNRKIIKEAGLTALDLLGPYELERITGRWAMPENHVFREIYYIFFNPVCVHIFTFKEALWAVI